MEDGIRYHDDSHHSVMEDDVSQNKTWQFVFRFWRIGASTVHYVRTSWVNHLDNKAICPPLREKIWMWYEIETMLLTAPCNTLFVLETNLSRLPSNKIEFPSLKKKWMTDGHTPSNVRTNEVEAQFPGLYSIHSSYFSVK